MGLRSSGQETHSTQRASGIAGLYDAVTNSVTPSHAELTLSSKS